MFKKETEYALRALVYVWQQNELDRRPGIIEIAEEIKAPQPFTAKILQRLVKSGLILSQKGKGGGFFYDSEQKEILLKEVVVLIEGKKIFTSCGFGLGNCSDKNPCPIHEQYVQVRNELEKVFSGNTIQNLASRQNEGSGYSGNA